MVNLHYTPEQLSRFTLPQFLCLLAKAPPTEKKLESMADFQKVIDEESRKEKEWFS